MPGAREEYRAFWKERQNFGAAKSIYNWLKLPK